MLVEKSGELKNMLESFEKFVKNEKMEVNVEKNKNYGISERRKKGYGRKVKIEWIGN